MGEYARLKDSGDEVKIGTCESMLYLRFDQVDQIEPMARSLDAGDPRVWPEIRFRFPWPSEDGVAPGSFGDPFRKMGVKVAPPGSVNHYSVQFVAREAGYNVCLPCPEGPDALDLPIHRNGFVGPTFIVEQAVRNGRLALVMSCVCGAKWHLPTLEDAEPVCSYLLDSAEQYARALPRPDTSTANSLTEIARRIRAGYSLELEAS